MSTLLTDALVAASSARTNVQKNAFAAQGKAVTKYACLQNGQSETAVVKYKVQYCAHACLCHKCMLTMRMSTLCIPNVQNYGFSSTKYLTAVHLQQ